MVVFIVTSLVMVDVAALPLPGRFLPITGCREITTHQ